ncbi:MAG: sulfatase-like hydrolase/transferase, partial [Ruthenibacterium sp.]
MKPNIIVFMTDHQRGDTILNDSKVKTPNVDRLRKQAVTFREAYCPSPHCCPSRATFFSGLYPSEHGVWNNVGVSNALSHDLFDDVRLFPQDLKEAGYRLYFSGKWHVSDVRGPADFGFELLYHNGHYAPRENLPDTKEWNNYTDATKIDTGTEVRTEARILRPGYTAYTQYGIDEDPFHDAQVVEAAVKKLETVNTEEPFFLFTGPLGPHDPYNVPQRFLDLYDPEEIKLPANFHDAMEDKPALYRRTQQRYAQLTEQEHRESIRRFYAFCSYEDYLFGQILDAVEQRGLMENTLILYASDHGDYIGAHGLWAKGLPCFREAYHICSMAGGGIVNNANREETALVSLADWAPTFLELAQISQKKKMVGRSLVPFLQDKQPKNWRTECYTQSNGNEVYGIQRAVFNKQWKYVFNAFDYD